VELPHDYVQWWTLGLTVLNLHVLTIHVYSLTAALYFIMSCLFSGCVNVCSLFYINVLHSGPVI